MSKLTIGEKVLLLTAPMDEGAVGLYDPVINSDHLGLLSGTITALSVNDEGEQLYEVEIVDGTNTYYSDYARSHILIKSDLSRLRVTFDRVLKEIA